LLLHCFMTDQPPSSSSVAHYHDTSSINLAMALPPNLHPPVLGSVTCICGQPQVFGFTDGFFIHRISVNDGLLMDSGANICITNLIDLLVNAVDIPPFTFFIGCDISTPNIDYCCTKHGLLPLPLVGVSLYYQPCYYCKNVTETIISPQAVIDASDTFISWHQSGHKGGLPGSICFESSSGLLSMTLCLQSINCLYYCLLDVLMVDDNPICPYLSVLKVALDTPIPHHWAPSKFTPVSKDCQLESEVWSLCLGCPGEH
jgi:hypothetical protein